MLASEMSVPIPRNRTVDGNKRGDLELIGYLGDGAQDLVLDFSMRHYRGGAAPRNWHRNGELLHPGRPDKDLDEKAASKIAKYRARSVLNRCTTRE